MTEPLHTVRFPGETDEYRRARDELLEAEIDLRRRTEAVAAKRRTLPLGDRITHALVKGIDTATAAKRVTDHIRKQGYHIVENEPDAETRMRYPKLARVVQDESFLLFRPIVLPTA